jgi:hypothetical protein
MARKKLTKAEQVDMWRDRIIDSQAYRDDRANRVWNDNLKAYRGQLKPPNSVWADTDPWVSVELVHSAVRATIPSLLYANPKSTVLPKRPYNVQDPETGLAVDKSFERAKSIELFLNHKWAETEGNTHVRLAITAAFLAFGAVKVGYAPDFADDDLRGEFQLDEFDEPIEDGEPDELGRQLFKLAKGEYLRDEDGEVIFDEDSGMPVLHPGRIQREQFFVEWVHWENILFDTSGGNVFKNHRYVIEEWCRPVEHVQNDPRYASWRKHVEGTERSGFHPSMELNNQSGDAYVVPVRRDEFSNDENDFVRGWDIYDFETNRLMVLLDQTEGAKPQNDSFIMDIEMPRGMEHGPFCFLKFNEDPGEWYPRTDVEGMSKVELEYNLIRSQQLTHRNQSRARYLESASVGFAGEDGGELERLKFATGPAGVVVKMKSVEGLQAAPQAPMDGTFFANTPNVRADFSEVAGQPGELRGVASADTATQASLLAGAADLRNNDRRDNLVQGFIVEIFRKMLQSAKANSSRVHYVRLAPESTVPNGTPFLGYAEINRELLADEVDVAIEVGSTQPKNNAARVALIERIYTLISQNLAIAASPTAMRRLFDALDIRDTQLEQELQRIGEMMLQAQLGVPQVGSEATGEQTLGDIQNQTVDVENALAGSGTGARKN